MSTSTKKATFAAGCFWAVEAAFMQTEGVTDTLVGFTGGFVENPTSAQVNADETGHAEGILLEYDENKVSYKELLNVFWSLHDPTSVNKQGPDVGSQYRSHIFYHDENQKKDAEDSIAQEQTKHEKPIVTQLSPASTFYAAEEKHQKYLYKQGQVSCPLKSA
eukprot:TRINITY_DN2078_c0_g2_i2.p1 TRINITY_DN2078_c0_g2~~TRINITY_DN2078_c0_g2_i2.p1  ORF type:complete len:162 (+),score=36.72 TRINITY_DN2078_c0_g2_i2:53-538(+)